MRINEDFILGDTFMIKHVSQFIKKNDTGYCVIVKIYTEEYWHCREADNIKTKAEVNKFISSFKKEIKLLEKLYKKRGIY